MRKQRERMLDELEQDIREHIEMETQDNIARGMPARASRMRARSSSISSPAAGSAHDGLRALRMSR